MKLISSTPTVFASLEATKPFKIHSNFMLAKDLTPHPCVAIRGVVQSFVAKKPLSSKYPKALRTIGDHLKKKRLDLKLFQKDVAQILGVDTISVCNWEKNRSGPAVRLIPQIITFLGYDPFGKAAPTLGQQIKQYRRRQGLSIKKLAKILGVDPTTLARWERGVDERRGKLKEQLNTFIKVLTNSILD